MWFLYYFFLSSFAFLFLFFFLQGCPRVLRHLGKGSETGLKQVWNQSKPIACFLNPNGFFRQHKLTSCQSLIVWPVWFEAAGRHYDWFVTALEIQGRNGLAMSQALVSNVFSGRKATSFRPVSNLFQTSPDTSETLCSRPRKKEEHELVTILWKKHKGRKKEIIQKPDCLSKSIVKGKEKGPKASKECLNEFT